METITRKYHRLENFIKKLTDDAISQKSATEIRESLVELRNLKDDFLKEVVELFSEEENEETRKSIHQWRVKGENMAHEMELKLQAIFDKRTEIIPREYQLVRSQK